MWAVRATWLGNLLGSVLVALMYYYRRRQPAAGGIPVWLEAAHENAR